MQRRTASRARRRDPCAPSSPSLARRPCRRSATSSAMENVLDMNFRTSSSSSSPDIENLFLLPVIAKSQVLHSLDRVEREAPREDHEEVRGGDARRRGDGRRQDRQPAPERRLVRSIPEKHHVPDPVVDAPEEIERMRIVPRADEHEDDERVEVDVRTPGAPPARVEEVVAKNVRDGDVPVRPERGQVRPREGPLAFSGIANPQVTLVVLIQLSNSPPPPGRTATA